MITITHVEDDADIREITMMALDLAGGFSLTQHPSGEAALADVTPPPPDLFLLDMMMPGMTGGQTLEKMRQVPHLAHVPAIFMTARSHQATLDTLRKSGPVAVIIKPVDPIALGDQIRTMLSEFTQDNPPS